MPNVTKKPPAQKHTPAGRRLIRSVKQAIAWANGGDVPVRVTMVSVERAPAVPGRDDGSPKHAYHPHHAYGATIGLRTPRRLQGYTPGGGPRRA
jgi:hypothetical protein